jgi:hypothetical protein
MENAPAVKRCIAADDLVVDVDYEMAPSFNSLGKIEGLSSILERSLDG